MKAVPKRKREKNVMKLNFMKYSLDYGRMLNLTTNFWWKAVLFHLLHTSDSLLFCFRYRTCYRTIFTQFYRNDKCTHLDNTWDCFCSFQWMGQWYVCECRITYFEHGSYDSVSAFDGNENADWGDLIKIFCGAVKQVTFKFSPTESLSVTRIELKIRVPGGALSKTSASYGTYKIHTSIKYIIFH